MGAPAALACAASFRMRSGALVSASAAFFDFADLPARVGTEARLTWRDIFEGGACAFVPLEVRSRTQAAVYQLCQSVTTMLSVPPADTEGEPVRTLMVSFSSLHFITRLGRCKGCSVLVHANPTEDEMVWFVCEEQLAPLPCAPPPLPYAPEAPLKRPAEDDLAPAPASSPPLPATPSAPARDARRSSPPTTSTTGGSKAKRHRPWIEHTSHFTFTAPPSPLGRRPVDPGNDALPFEHERLTHRLVELLPGTTLSVCTINEAEFLIGIQVAHLLGRETHNIYRALRRRGVCVYRGSQADVDTLTALRAVSGATKALSFLPKERTLAYIKEQLAAGDPQGSSSNSDA